jgi:nicotinamide phosphoribosyltransferase
MDNIILLTDGYKVSHHKMLPPNTEYLYSYLESRGGEVPLTCFFGLQYILLKYLAGPVVTREKIDYAEKYFAKYFGNVNVFNKAGWEYILEKHGGFLPLKIDAVPEGTVLPSSLPLVTIVNTDPNCAWLTNYVETILMQVWSPTTVASRSLQSKKSILKYLKATGTPETIDFKLHDFGYRGVSSNETAGLAGAAHLVHFKGSDTLAANDLILKYYENGDLDKMPSFSIPASEHSTITAWGKENEVKAFENILDKYPEGIVACVSDSYDIDAACNQLWESVRIKL